MLKLMLGALLLLPAHLTLAVENTTAPMPSTSFNSHLHSAAIVSPAQMYAVQGLQTDLSLGYRKSDHETITNQGKWDFEWMSSILNLTAVTNMPIDGLHVGLNISSVLSEPDEIIKGTGIPELLQTTTQSAHTKYSAVNTLHVSPLISYHLKDMVALGLQVNYQFVDRDYSIARIFTNNTDMHTSTSSYSLVPAFTVTATGFEAGVAWRTAESGDDVEMPSMLTMHGRYAVGEDLHFGGIYQLKRHSTLKAGHDDQSIFKATVEWQYDQLRVEGNVAYATSFYTDNANITAHNIATISTHTAVDYRITDNAVAGAAVGYTFGEDTSTTTEYNMQEMDFALRGNYLF